MDNKYENIVPWNGAQDTGRDVRLKLDRNFDRIKVNFEELLNELKKKLSNSEPDEATEVIAFLKGLKVSDRLISRLLLRDTEVDELLDTDIMSALRVMAEINENNDNLEKLFLSKSRRTERRSTSLLKKAELRRMVLSCAFQNKTPRPL